MSRPVETESAIFQVEGETVGRVIEGADSGVLRVAVAEDYGGLSSVMREVIDRNPQMTCCGCFASGSDLIEKVGELQPDIVSLDLSMPEMNGFEVLKRLRQVVPEIGCLVFSGFAEEEYVRGAFAAGAQGYIFKEDFREFIDGIREVAAGRRFLSSRFAAIEGLMPDTLS